MSTTQTNATATNWTAQAKALEENNSSTWKPDSDGAAIAGRVLRIEENTGTNGDSTLVEVETEDQMQVGIWLSTVLERQWQKERPTVGDVIGIKYHGKRTSPKSGREYKSFTLKVLERGEAFKDDIPY